MLAKVRVFTFKAGLLAKLAHDLELSVQRFEIVVEQRKLHAWFDADSLQVEGVVHPSGVDRNALSAHDREQILSTARVQLLDAPHHPRIEFNGTLSAAGTLRVDGTLCLRGHSEALSFEVAARGQQLQATVPLTPSRFGIAPYKTLGGAIRLQDRVVVEVTLQLGEAEARTIAEKNEVVNFRPNL